MTRYRKIEWLARITGTTGTGVMLLGIEKRFKDAYFVVVMNTSTGDILETNCSEPSEDLAYETLEQIFSNERDFYKF